MSCEHLHRPTQRYLALPVQEKLEYLKIVRQGMIDRNDLELLECIDHDLNEIKQQVQQEMLDDAVVIYKLVTPPRA